MSVLFDRSNVIRIINAFVVIQTTPRCALSCNRAGFHLIFKMRVVLHADKANESTVLIDTTVQEKNITYPTDTKLAIKIINRLNKLANAMALNSVIPLLKRLNSLLEYSPLPSC